jgi:hypothetical protein
MNDADKALAIYNLVARVTEQARQDQRRAVADYAGTARSAEIWRGNPDNAMDHCPYNVKSTEDRLARADAEVVKWEQVLNFAVKTFVSEKS